MKLGAGEWVGRGAVSCRAIFTMQCNVVGYPMGPIELSDYVGLDINKFVLDGE